MLVDQNSEQKELRISREPGAETPVTRNKDEVMVAPELSPLKMGDGKRATRACN